MPKNSQEYEWILLKFSQYLMSTSHNVRMLASKVIHEMFLSSFALTNEFSLDVVKESTEKRKSFYEVFYNTLLKAYDCPVKRFLYFSISQVDCIVYDVLTNRTAPQMRHSGMRGITEQFLYCGH